jgi:sporulation protein YlmC with PRC-barrel domain
VKQQQASNNSPLERLSDSSLVLSEPDQDIRGRKVIDQHGADIGHVSGLFIDEGERKVRMLELRSGGFIGIGERHFLLPVDAISSVDENEVHVSESGARIIHSPIYDPTLVVPSIRGYWEPYYGYYGLSPHWGNGYMYPTFPWTQGANLNDHADIRSVY